MYHPLRLGTLVKCREQDDRLYFRVKLEEFVYPRDIVRFNDIIKSSLGPMGLPNLTGNDPYRTDDGYYAISAGSLFSHVGDSHWGEDAWKSTVEELRKTQAFREAATPAEVAEEDIIPKEFIFIRCDVREQSTYKVPEERRPTRAGSIRPRIHRILPTS